MFNNDVIIKRQFLHKNLVVFELHIQKVTCVQISKFVLNFKPMITNIFLKNSKKVVNYNVIFNMMTLLPKLLQI